MSHIAKLLDAYWDAVLRANRVATIADNVEPNELSLSLVRAANNETDAARNAIEEYVNGLEIALTDSRIKKEDKPPWCTTDRIREITHEQLIAGYFIRQDSVGVLQAPIRQEWKVLYKTTRGTYVVEEPETPKV